MGAGWFKKLFTKKIGNDIKPLNTMIPENSESFKNWMLNNPPKLAVMPRDYQPKLH